jgi:uncharacterized protein (DUF1810 family)
MATAEDRFNLQRFVDAQDSGGTYEQALNELRQGRKRGHWIWFLFPQIAGLGSSETARFYAIASLEEATAYLKHPILGPRLDAAAEALLKLPERDPVVILGDVDAMKLRSSMTLFGHVADAAPAFSRVLDEFYGGQPDAATERRLV